MSHLLPPFTKVLARRPSTTMAEGLTTSTHLGTPSHTRAKEQYDTYLKAVEACGVEVTVAPTDERYPDGHFVEDPFVIYKTVAFECYSGAQERQGEAERLRPYLSDLQHIQAPPGAFIDGGDVLFCADRVLVGLSLRTNQEGIQALRQALQTVQPDIRVDAVPFSGPLHLKSGLTELAPNVLIHDPALQTSYDLSWATVHTLPAEEGYAADVMPINNTLFVPKGFPTALQVAQQYCDSVVALDMSEFQKMDGGLTCLSLRY